MSRRVDAHQIIRFALVMPGAIARTTGEALLVVRHVEASENGGFAIDQTDHYRPLTRLVDVVFGAVDRIDEPAPLSVRFADPGGFLRQYIIVGEACRQPCDDQ